MSVKLQLFPTDNKNEFVIDLEYDLRFRTRISVQDTVHIDQISEKLLAEITPLLKFKIKEALGKLK